MNPIRIELPTEFAVGSVNAYLFTEPEPVLVDTGVKLDSTWNVLQESLAGHDLTIADVKRIIITHPHVDHFGLAGRMVEHSDAQVWVSELGKSWVVDFPSMWQKRVAYYRDVLLGYVGFPSETEELILNYMSATVSVCDKVPQERVNTFPTNATLQMGGMDWQVIHTPGHANHHTCFYQADTCQLLSADMLMAKAPTPIVERPPSGRKHVPALPKFLESLALVESLEIDQVYPGHGEPFGQHREVINRQRQRIAKRKAQCLHLIAEGYMTLASLVGKMYAHLPAHFSFAGLWMLVGYIDLLKAEGQVLETEINGVWHYQVVEKLP